MKTISSLYLRSSIKTAEITTRQSNATASHGKNNANASPMKNTVHNAPNP